jgi:hypothetical protein
MSDGTKVETVVDSLKRRGQPDRNHRWVDGDPDYVAEYSLTADHIPALIELAATVLTADSCDPDELYAQVHAWRALAQLQAVEAVQPLLDVQERLDAIGDDWYLEEFHHVFGMIGPAAIDRLAAFLGNSRQTRFPRQKAGSGLAEIARRFPDNRDRVLAVLTSELDRHQEDGDLNGALVMCLLDLQAVEAAESIERAFAANVVDPTFAGDWGDVRRELGVEGLGLAPDVSPGWQTLQERFGMTSALEKLREAHAATVAARQEAQEKRRLNAAKQKARDKRKEQKKSRKRNRRPR